jgi:hypothetical protein
LYASKKRRVCGIFSALLILCAICFFPTILVGAIAAGVVLPVHVYTVIAVYFPWLFIANPFIQSYFRPDVKNVVANMWHFMTKRISCVKKDEGEDSEHTNISLSVQIMVDHV